MRLINKNITVFYLPNARAREIYVDKIYPLRRNRFQQNVSALLDKHKINYLSLKDHLGNNHLYEDFHHWNYNGSLIGTKLVATYFKNSI